MTVCGRLLGRLFDDLMLELDPVRHGTLSDAVGARRAHFKRTRPVKSRRSPRPARQTAPTGVCEKQRSISMVMCSSAIQTAATGLSRLIRAHHGREGVEERSAFSGHLPVAKLDDPPGPVCAKGQVGGDERQASEWINGQRAPSLRPVGCLVADDAARNSQL